MASDWLRWPGVCDHYTAWQHNCEHIYYLKLSHLSSSRDTSPASLNQLTPHLAISDPLIGLEMSSQHLIGWLSASSQPLLCINQTIHFFSQFRGSCSVQFIKVSWSGRTLLTSKLLECSSGWIIASEEILFLQHTLDAGPRSRYPRSRFNVRILAVFNGVLYPAFGIFIQCWESESLVTAALYRDQGPVSGAGASSGYLGPDNWQWRGCAPMDP